MTRNTPRLKRLKNRSGRANSHATACAATHRDEHGRPGSRQRMKAPKPPPPMPRAMPPPRLSAKVSFNFQDCKVDVEAWEAVCFAVTYLCLGRMSAPWGPECDRKHGEFNIT
eukprot:1394211-Amorphochlora_amoeboformis.AAC.2